MSARRTATETTRRYAGDQSLARVGACEEERDQEEDRREIEQPGLDAGHLQPEQPEDRDPGQHQQPALLAAQHRQLGPVRDAAHRSGTLSLVSYWSNFETRTITSNTQVPGAERITPETV